MITFRHMTLLARLPARHARLALAVAAVTGLATAPTRAGAQVAVSHTEDAAPIPAGVLRFRVVNAWTRYDERFTASGTAPLGDDFSTDSLGARQLPRLLPVEGAMQGLANDSRTRLSFGRLDMRSGARIVTTPIALEYGVTRWLSVGVMVPVVQTRRNVNVRVNPFSLLGPNAGVVQASQRSAAASANLAVAIAFQQAADSLGALISRCSANPAGANCANVTANASDAAAARQQAANFATLVRQLGVSAATALVAPRAGGTFAVESDSERVRLNRRLQQYLGASYGANSSIFFTNSSFTYVDLQGSAGAPGLLQDSLGGGLDSLHTTERIGLGDIEVGAQLQLFDQFQRDGIPHGLQTRLSVGGSLRFATSRRDSATNLLDIPTGDGAGFELRSAFDAIVGRAGGTVAARFVRSFARDVTGALFTPELPFPYPVFGPMTRRAGDVVAIDVTPRYLISESLAINGYYGMERMGAATYESSLTSPCINCQPSSVAVPLPDPSTASETRTSHRAGLGLRFSTVDAWLRGGAAYPVEVSLTHLETVSGTPGTPKLSRDQIQVRLFYRIFGRR